MASTGVVAAAAGDRGPRFRVPQLGVALHIRWLLPVVFVLGYVATFSTFEDFAFEYFILTALSFGACCLLLTVLDRPLQVTAPLGVLLLLFLGAYYLQFYWIAYSPDIARTVWFGHLGWIASSAATLVEAYATTTYGFITFCLTACLLIKCGRGPERYRRRREIKYKSLTSLMLWVIPVLMGVTTYLVYITGIAVMGAQGVQLPFRLAGVIFYTRVTVIPALLLLLIWCSDRMNMRKQRRIGIILLLLHGLSDILLRGSRGALLLLAVSLMFLFLFTSRMNRQRAWFITISVFLTILLWPVISAYRYLRDPVGSIVYTLGGALNTIWQGAEPLWQIQGDALKQLIFRVTGMGSLLPIVGVDIQPLGITNFFDPIVERVFTVQVYGYSPEAIQGAAPGLLGWFHLVGGNILVVIGVFWFVLITWYLWVLAKMLRLYCLPVAQSMLLSYILGFAMEGAMDRLILVFLTTVAVITVCEMLIRNSTRPHWLRMP